jgi:hypothetical protein
MVPSSRPSPRRAPRSPRVRQEAQDDHSLPEKHTRRFAKYPLRPIHLACVTAGARARLFGKAGGFEGFVATGVELGPDDPSAAQTVQVRGLAVDLGSTRSAVATVAAHDEN